MATSTQEPEAERNPLLLLEAAPLSWRIPSELPPEPLAFIERNQDGNFSALRFSAIKEYIVLPTGNTITKAQLQAVITQCQQCIALMGT